tara:strand:+ start:292 stop:852 length:561 start_codon:yes stop_codon:yes gene_type:complete
VIVIGIDPGATIGLCVYDTTAGNVLYSGQYRDPVAAIDKASCIQRWDYQIDAIGIERARIYGAGGAHVANTIEQVGWFLGRYGVLPPASSDAIQYCGGSVYTLERRAVVKALSVEMGESVKGDAGVWQALCRVHPDAMRRPVAAKPATRTKPAVDAVEAGPLYGVSSHARAALAVAWALGKHLEAR